MAYNASEGFMTGEPSGLFEVEQDKVCRAVHGLMSSARDVSDLASDSLLSVLVRHEYEDIELVHQHLGRVLTELRKG